MSQMPTQNSLEKKSEDIPEGLWMRCPECGGMLFRKVVEEALSVCPDCQHHFRLSARTRIAQLVDPGSFEEMFTDIEPSDPIKFVDKKAYKDRLESEGTGFHRAVFDAYEELAAAYPQRIVAVDGERDPGVVAADIWAIVSDRLGKDGAA